MASKDKFEDRDQQILSRLANIQHKVDSIDETNAFALRADADKYMEIVERIFKHGMRRAQVYLAADGARGVSEIAAFLGMKQPNVSRDVTVLKEEGLLELGSAVGRRDIWAKKSIDRTLRISKYLRGRYSLEPDGRPAKASKNGKRKKR